MIVDAQIHLWSKGTPSAHHRQTPFLKEEALAMMDAAGVDRAVVHPVMWDPDSNELAVEAARAHPDRFAIMGWVYLDQPAQRALLETWKSRPGMKGLRFYFSDPQSLTWPDDGNLDWVFPVAERLGIPATGRRNCREASGVAPQRRSHGCPARDGRGRGGLSTPRSTDRAGETSERGGESDGAGGLRDGCISIFEHP